MKLVLTATVSAKGFKTFCLFVLSEKNISKMFENGDIIASSIIEECMKERLITQ